jgi:hypothetical protein
MKEFGALVTISLGLSGAPLVPAEGWHTISDPAALRALHSNKTFHAGAAPAASAIHYRSDGRALWIAGTRRIARTWTIKGRDQVCYRDEVLGRHCVRLQQNARYPRELLVRSVDGRMGSFVTVEDGVPQF